VLPALQQRVRARPWPSPWLVLGAVIAVSAGLRAWAGSMIPVPWIAPDEMIYGLTGRSLYHSGSLSILGGPTPFYSLIVPAFTGLPLSLRDTELGYGLLKALQAVAMSLTALPVFLWGRTLVSTRWALVAAALTVALPGLVYSGLVMSEVLFYPVLLLAAWAAARAIERPTPGRQALLAVAVLAAVLTRLQALVLLPALATAIGLDAALARSLRPLRRLAPTLGLIAAAAVGWAAWQAAGGSAGLGGYDVVAHESYRVGTAARFVLYHAGSLAILTGVFPLCALLLLLVRAGRHGEPDPRRRAFLAVACSLAVWFVLEVGVFASRYVGQLAERDLIALAPLLFLAFSLWIDRGAPRSYWTASLVALVVAGFVVFLPLDSLVTSYAPPDAPTLAVLYDLRHATSESTLAIVFYVCFAAALAALALVPRRLVAVLPLVLAGALAGASVAASRYAAAHADLRQTTLVGSDPAWIDRAATGPVAYLYDRRTDWISVWESVFWNRKVKQVYGLDGARVFGPMPQRPLQVRPDGRLVAPGGSASDPTYLVAPLGSVSSEPTYWFAGDLVASAVRTGSRTGNLGLWKIDPPLRLSFRTSGLAPNGDVYAGGDARLVAYGCAGRVFQVTMLVKEPQAVILERNGVPFRRIAFKAATVWRGSIPTATAGQAAERASCTLDVRPTGLIGTTVFQVQDAPAGSSR
jgi:hypothetical protein